MDKRDGCKFASVKKSHFLIRFGKSKEFKTKAESAVLILGSYVKLKENITYIFIVL